MIIDAHAHLGFDEVFDEDFTEDTLLESQRQQGIAVTLLQPAIVHDLETVQSYHNTIAALAARYPGHFYGIANPNPHLPGSLYEDEVRRCVEELGFIGVKLHPFAHAVNPAGRHGRRVFDIAARLALPVIVHTGSGIPWSAPSLLDPIANAYPGLPIIIAHAGMMVLAAEATQIASRHANIYLECSWSGGFLVREWVHKFGAQRVLFGSDHADNAATELAKFRSCGLTDDELKMTLGGTAATIFSLLSGNYDTSCVVVA